MRQVSFQRPVQIKGSNASCMVSERHYQAIMEACRLLDSTALSLYVEHIVLYGSTARGDGSFGSDVDMLVELSEEARRIPDYQARVRNLKSEAAVLGENLPEVDIRVVFGEKWRSSRDAIYQAVRRDGIWVK